MKKLILFIFIIFSCDMVNYNIWNIPEIDIESYNNGYDPVKNITRESLLFWVNRNIKYKIENYWKTPSEVYYSKNADCKGMSTLLASLLYKYFPSDKVYILFVDTNNGFIPNHVVVKCNGIIYDPTNKNIYNEKVYIYRIIYTYNILEITNIMSFYRPSGLN